MGDCRAASTPLEQGCKLVLVGEPLNTAAIGALTYIGLGTRPDISQAVGVLARFQTAPTTEHWKAAMHVLRYLAGTRELGITYGGGGAIGVIGYCDADYAGDLVGRRSTSGFTFIFCNGAVSWGSRLQPTVAVSTTEAEYMAVSEAVKEAMWLRQLVRSMLGREVGSVPISCDSESALATIRNPIVSQRAKHIDVRYHFVRERAEMGVVVFESISTDEMAADFLTKIVTAAKHMFCRERLGMV